MRKQVICLKVSLACLNLQLETHHYQGKQCQEEEEEAKEGMLTKTKIQQLQRRGKGKKQTSSFYLLIHVLYCS